MLKLSSNLQNLNVASLRTGGSVGLAQRPIINPHNLKIIGWWCRTPARQQSSVLLTEDIRDSVSDGLVINDEEDITAPEDLVRLKEVLDINYDLIGKPVKTKRSKLGKVSDYSYNEGMFIQKLYVERPMVKVFSMEDTLIIDRRQILEVTDHYILVNDTDIKASDALPAAEAVPAA
jgi:hypothetical protein